MSGVYKAAVRELGFRTDIFCFCFETRHVDQAMGEERKLLYGVHLVQHCNLTFQPYVCATLSARFSHNPPQCVNMLLQNVVDIM